MGNFVKILIANYRYFISSGPERYLFNLKRELEQVGHEVLPFSVRYSLNEPSPYSKYFVSPLAGEDEVFFDQHKKTLKSTAKTLSRLFYSPEVKTAVQRMIDDTKPDIAYVLYYLRKMSPSLLTGIKSRNLPIVVRISDYGMMCGEHHMLRGDAVCTRCIDEGSWSQVKYKCIKGSTAISAVDYFATRFHQWRGYFDMVDRFITTNDFMSEMMVRAGVKPDRIVCNPTFTDGNLFRRADAEVKPDYLIYVGRIDRPKGVHVLIEAMRHLRERGRTVPNLKLVGAGHTQEYVQSVKQQVEDGGLSDRISFMEGVKPNAIADLFRNAYAAIMPALWFENLPNSVLEAFASGCPVISSQIGSLSSIVTHDVDGLHFPPGDADALADAIDRLVSDQALRNRLSEGASHTSANVFSSGAHVEKLLDLFSSLLPEQIHPELAKIA